MTAVWGCKEVVVRLLLMIGIPVDLRAEVDNVLIHTLDYTCIVLISVKFIFSRVPFIT